MPPVILFALLLQATTGNPLSTGARSNYGIVKNWIPRAAAKMPEEYYDFRPAPAVRSFSQLIGHLADANYRMCSAVAGDNPAMDEGIEKSKSLKSDLVKALDQSFAYCDNVYANMTDTAGTTIINFDAGGEGTRRPIQMPQLSALAFHTQHAFEHYGNIVTYLRMKGIVPPDSELTSSSPLTTPGDAKPGSHKDVGGEWKVQVETPNGPVTARLIINIDGSNLAGMLDWDRGTVALTGTLTPRELRLNGQWQTLKLVFLATPGAEALAGTVDFVGHPSGTWTAFR